MRDDSFGFEDCRFAHIYVINIFSPFLADDGNHALQEFLNSLNPRQQQSTTLESYLG